MSISAIVNFNANVSQSYIEGRISTNYIIDTQPIYRYRLKLWGNILLEDNTAESINFVSMILSMVAIVMKNKACGWISILVSAIAYGNARTSQEGQQLLSTFMLGSTALVLCYITNPAPIALSLIEADDRSPPTGAS